jgi:exo-rhamnogalacturonan lyase-like protein
MKMLRIIAWTAVLTCALGLPAAAALEVPLTVEERAGVNRVDEPVTVGLPLPKGAISRARLLELTGPGGVVPCQFTEMARWSDGKSVKWVLLNFKATVAAKQKATYTVKLAKARARALGPMPVPMLLATKAGDVVTVNTGRVKFTVRGKNFDGFHEAWFDPAGKGNFTAANQVIKATKTSGCVSASKGIDYLSALDGAGKVSIERQGTMEVVVKAEGSHKRDGKLFDYIVRFHAYADSPVVRVKHTFVCRQGAKPSDVFPMDALEFVVPTRLGGGTASAGIEGGKAVSASELLVLQRTSDAMAVTSGGRTLASAKGKSTKTMSTGWIDVQKGGLGLAAGVRWFWQMHPKALSVDKAGVLTVGLFPRQAIKTGDAEKDKFLQQPFDVYMGQSRTHTVTFLFHKGMAADDLAAFFTGTQKPLTALAPLRWYCRDTAALGYIAESDATLFTDAQWAKVKSYDKKMLDSLLAINKKIDGHTYRHTSDSYGFYNWGDTFHWGWKGKDKSPKDSGEWLLSFAGNYYDFPNACLVQFLRTGDWRFYDRFVPNAMHVGDVFTCQYHPKKYLWGACRYCPPRNHVGVDNGSPYVSVEFNHNKSQCVFSLYYLTGDLRALDNAKLLANNAVTNRVADNGKQARGPGAHICALWQTYELWPTEAHMKRMQQMVNRTSKRLSTNAKSLGQKWMWGIAFEGCVYYLWSKPGDDVTFGRIKAGIDKFGSRADDYGNMALVNAYLYGRTGEQKYADQAWTAVGKGRVKNRPKTFGVQWRNTGFALYFLSNACKPAMFEADR